MEPYYLLLLGALTSLALFAAGRRWLPLPSGGGREALLRALECAGLTFVLLVLNVAAGFLLVLALRALTGSFVSLYLNTDAVLVLISVLQAVALQWWMGESENG